MNTTNTGAPGAHPSRTPTAHSLFLEQLLAPIPDSEEQADTPAFRKRIERDKLMPWRKAMEVVEVAKARHTIAAITGRNSGDHLSAEILATWSRLVAAQRAQCLVPAPTMKEVRWKKRQLPSLIREPDIAAAIAADEARLQGGCNV